MEKFTTVITPEQIKEFNELKDKLFNGEMFVVPADFGTPECFTSPEWARYDELLKLVMMERSKSVIDKPDVFMHRFNSLLFCEIMQSTRKGYKVLQATIRG